MKAIEPEVELEPGTPTACDHDRHLYLTHPRCFRYTPEFTRSSDSPSTLLPA